MDLDAFLDDLETLFNVTKLNNDNIQNSGITGADKLIDGTVTLAKMGANSVDSEQLVADSVTAAKLNADCAGSGLTQAVDGSLALNPDDSTLEVSSDMLQVKDGGITQAKLADKAFLSSSACGLVSEDDSTFVTVTNLTKEITTTGRPVLVVVNRSADSDNSQVKIGTDTNSSVTAEYVIRRSGTIIELFTFAYETPSGSTGYPVLSIPASCIVALDEPYAGTYTYDIQQRVATAGNSGTDFMYSILTVVEI
jgi:hypothetical protein